MTPTHTDNARLVASNKGSEPTRSEAFDADGIGMSCSGGGYKSGVFQAGAFIRLNQAGLLRKIDRISSVSGGSITAAWLAVVWNDLDWSGGIARNFDVQFAKPLRTFYTRRSIDVSNIVAGLALPGRSGASGLCNAYDKYLFKGRTLQDFPDPRKGEAPRFVVLATDFELNNLWRFAKPYAANYRIGQISNPDFPVAAVVTASSAFPPFFCPFKISLTGHTITPYPNADLYKPPYTQRMVLGDAGIYDNLGVEPIWRRYGTLLLSNAGDPFGEVNKSARWSKVVRRSMSMIHRQAENNRMRWLHSLKARRERVLADWHLRESSARYEHIQVPMALAGDDLKDVQNYSVRLKAMPDRDYDLILRHGYSMCDAALKDAGLILPSTPAPGP